MEYSNVSDIFLYFVAPLFKDRKESLLAPPSVRVRWCILVFLQQLAPAMGLQRGLIIFTPNLEGERKETYRGSRPQTSSGGHLSFAFLVSVSLTSPI